MELCDQESFFYLKVLKTLHRQNHSIQITYSNRAYYRLEAHGKTSCYGF